MSNTYLLEWKIRGGDDEGKSPSNKNRECYGSGAELNQEWVNSLYKKFTFVSNNSLVIIHGIGDPTP